MKKENQNGHKRWILFLIAALVPVCLAAARPAEPAEAGVCARGDSGAMAGPAYLNKPVTVRIWTTAPSNPSIANIRLTNPSGGSRSDSAVFDTPPVNGYYYAKFIFTPGGRGTWKVGWTIALGGCWESQYPTGTLKINVS